MIGTLINVAGVIVGSLLGTLLGERFPARFRQTVISGIGLFTVGFGLQMFLATKNVLVVLGSILLGAILGEWMRLEERLENIGELVSHKFSQPGMGESKRFVQGFLTAGVLFCVGPMAIVGSIRDGLTGDFSILALKAVLDAVTALAFASTMGMGVLFSAGLVFLYQGGIALLASQAQAIISPAMTAELTAAGGVLLIGIGISSILEIKKIRVANLLPALVLAPVAVYFLTVLGIQIGS